MFINLVAPINQLGYGIVGFNVLKALVELGHTVSLFPIGNVEVEKHRPTIELVQKCIQNAAFFMPTAPSIRIWHQNDLAMFPGKGKRIGWPIFELDTFDERELHHLNNVDSLFVCSDWARGVVRSNGILVPTHTIPLGVDSSVFYMDTEASKQRPYHTLDKTVFINVGKWEVRKGHNELLEAFNAAFGPNDNVELWMVNDNPFIGMENEQWAAKYITSKNGPNIRIVPRVSSQHELRALFNQVDWGVFPSHAEGWNLEPLELMACGVPCIATDYSGHTQYLNTKNSILIPSRGAVKAIDGKWFNGQGSWCSYDVADLVAALKEAHRINMAGRCNDNGVLPWSGWSEVVSEYSKNFTWTNTANEIVKVLRAA